MSEADRYVVLAVDPGRDKCGVAVCEPGLVRERAIVAPARLASLAHEWQHRHGVVEIVVGDRTGSGEVVRLLAGKVSVPVRLVDESGTTLRARARYFAEHPPRGWRRLVPKGLQTPPEPYDDYAAIVIAQEAIAQRAGRRPSG